MIDVETCEFSRQEIMAMEHADELFSSQPKNVEFEYKNLVRRWHPDLPRGDVAVMSRVNVLHDQAEKEIAAGTWYAYHAPSEPVWTPSEPVHTQSYQPPVVAAYQPWDRDYEDLSIRVIGYGVFPSVLISLVLTGHVLYAALALVVITLVCAAFYAAWLEEYHPPKQPSFKGWDQGSKRALGGRLIFSGLIPTSPLLITLLGYGYFFTVAGLLFALIGLAVHHVFGRD